MLHLQGQRLLQRPRLRQLPEHLRQPGLRKLQRHRLRQGRRHLTQPNAQRPQLRGHRDLPRAVVKRKIRSPTIMSL